MEKLLVLLLLANQFLTFSSSFRVFITLQGIHFWIIIMSPEIDALHAVVIVFCVSISTSVFRWLSLCTYGLTLYTVDILLTSYLFNVHPVYCCTYNISLCSCKIHFRITTVPCVSVSIGKQRQSCPPMRNDICRASIDRFTWKTLFKK